MSIKPDRTVLRLSFPHPIYGTYTPVKVEYEYQLGPNDNDQDALDDGKTRAEAWFNSRYPPIDGPGPSFPIVEKERSTDPVAAMIADIYTCTDLKVLKTYEMLATRQIKSNPEIMAAYEMMKQKLSI